MNESAKKRHLLQRFAFGANFEDSKAYAGLSVDQTLDRLLDVSGELQTAEPMHWVFYGTEEDPFPGSFKFGSYWMHEILTSERPLREQMAIFWHDHFAATDTKIESGPIMHDYVRALRNDPLGRFRDILHRCVTTVAVLKELDVRGMSRKLPNENFAREVLELHTMGIGRYTEEDIQNLALTFQGWGWFDVYYEMETTHRERMRRVAEEGREFHAFAVMPSLAGRKKIRLFHQDLELDGFEALDLLAKRTETRDYITEKLWRHFAGADPMPGALSAMRQAWDRTQGSIRECLRAMAQHPDFYSEAVVGRRVKPPLDFYVSALRSQGVGRDLAEWAKADDSKFDTPCPENVWIDTAYTVGGVQNAGMLLMNPPSVAGWDWGPGWVSTDLMTRRMEFTGSQLQWEEYQKDGEKAYRPTARGKRLPNFVREKAGEDPMVMAAALNEYFDAGLGEESLAKIGEFLKSTWDGWTKDEPTFAWRLTLATRMVFSAPEHHLH
jgi:uncharacterized protein (DUF1800 family)